MEQGAIANGSSIESRLRRRPALLAVFALAAGIILERWWGLPTWGAFTATVLCLMATAVLHRARPRAATVCLLLTLVALGAARFHLFWSVRPENDIARFATEDPRIVRVQGVIVTEVELVDSPVGPRIPSWLEIDHSRGVLRCDQLQVDDDWVPVAGLVQLDVEGHLVHARVGDRVEVLGKLSVPGPPQNPGGGDYRDHLRSQGLDAVLRVSHPLALTFQSRERCVYWTLVRIREDARDWCRHALTQRLKGNARPIAISLLLGDRSLMTEDLREKFSESGTMHLLAISGMHVAIVLWFILLACRGLNLSSGMTALLLISTALAYATLTNQQPSVHRATLLAITSLVGAMMCRSVDGLNLLAVCALVLLLWHPADLFNIGALFSFLAVATLFWSSSINWQTIFSCWREPDLDLPKPPLMAAVQRFGGRVGQSFFIIAVIWGTTLPLSLLTFHLVSPAGLVLNLFLIPLSTAILGLGYLFLFCAWGIPWLAWPLGGTFQFSLNLFSNLVSWERLMPLGHLYAAGPPVWWVIGFYVLLIAAWVWFGTPRSGRIAWRLLAVWIVCGLTLGIAHRGPDSLRCTFLSVGHGLATVIELPGGGTLVYDVGTIGDGSRAERAVENYLWSRGISRIDALVISHPDHDHYSGVFGLLEKVPVGTLCFAQSFLDADQRGTLQLCEQASARGVNIRILQAGDQLVASVSGVDVEVLHPSGDFRSKTDNANSVVLDLRYAGRSILLTGDVDRDGLQTLMKRPPRRQDVLLSPHHGGRNPEAPMLYAWARPDYVIASTGRRDVAPTLQDAPAAQAFRTDQSGAVTVVVQADGTLSVSTFLGN